MGITMAKIKTSPPKKMKRIQTPLNASRKRRFVRLDVAAPFELNRLNLPPKKGRDLIDPRTLHGVILNISGSGVLSLIDMKLKVDSYVVICLNLNGIEKIENVLGKVKRVEKLEYSEYLTGIEFTYPQTLYSEFPLDGLRKNEALFSFDEQIQRLILRYIFQRQITNKAN
ncbi:MAG: hypothetical protein CO189_09560 [candidate division Zixibacteria bacterium CG_4_9_14_3_um_filter_46_8]|nr:MAG: hypothetical protein CO189_09560 [candidate division Zixibacteria bacterium CG_4_9_14_3_um_filter_46_8]